MLNKNKDHILNIIGLIFLLFGIAAIINTFLVDHPSKIIYFCYLALLHLGFGALRRNNNLIMSQLYILTIPLMVWNADFFYQLITGTPLTGITSYFFEGSFSNISKLISLQHLFTIPLGIYASKLVGKKETRALKVSLVELLVIFFISLAITPYEINVNCVHYFCGNIKIPLYQFIYLPFFAGMIFLTKYTFDKILSKNN